MKALIKKVYTNFVPKSLQAKIDKRRSDAYFDRMKWRVIDCCNALPSKTEEQLEVIEYLKKHPICPIPHPFKDHYHPEDIKVFDDEANGLKYVLFEEKKLYFKRGWTNEHIQDSYNNLLVEQDINSPHRYLLGDFDVAAGDVIVDIGAAEGNFSLSVVEKAGKIVMFETDAEWIEALEATFKPWRDKIIIINKFVSNKNDAQNITLDSFLKQENINQINFIKLDVEGVEMDVLQGSEKIIQSEFPLKIALCTYHRQGDDVRFSEYLNKKNFNCTVSKGYMLFFYHESTFIEPYLRRGLIRAQRQN